MLRFNEFYGWSYQQKRGMLEVRRLFGASRPLVRLTPKQLSKKRKILKQSAGNPFIQIWRGQN